MGAALALPLSIDAGYTPERDAFGYPGPDLGCSFLLTPHAVLRIEERPGAPLGASLVHGPGGRRRAALDTVLAAAGEAPADARYPVVAFGSNRNPHHLAYRLREIASYALPVVRARLHGAAVVFPAYVGLYGVVTSTLLADPGTVSHVHLLLCDRNQLDALHAAEGTGIRHDFGALEDCAATLDNGEQLAAPHAFSCRPGVLAIDGSPRRLARVPVQRSGLAPATLEEVTAWLVRQARAAALEVSEAADVQALCLAGRRDELLEVLRPHARPDGLRFARLNGPDRPRPVPPPYRAAAASRRAR